MAWEVSPGPGENPGRRKGQESSLCRAGKLILRQLRGAGRAEHGFVSSGQLLFPEDRFDKQIGFSLAVNHIYGLVRKIFEALFPSLPTEPGLCPRPSRLVILARHPQLGPRLFALQVLEHCGVGTIWER